MSPHTVEVHIEEPYRAHRQARLEVLRRAAESTLRQQDVAEACELTVMLAGDETLRELNRRHRGVEAPTDVLAFPNVVKGPFVEPPGLQRYLGDVIVSFPRAMAQAAEAGHELLAELQLLVVHGILHLLGYDDQTGPERARMWRAQQAVLDDLGVDVHLPD
ncbi:MAG: rRNA maturation RNase YbeY [Anaerolineae bacterium]|jgi:probable rRNA maturation factor